MKYKDMEGWQKKKLLFFFLTITIAGTCFLGATSVTLFRDKMEDNDNWKKYLHETTGELQAEADERSQSATTVQVGTYIENLKEIAIKGSYYQAVALVWFHWTGDETLDMKNNFRVYKGTINHSEVVKDYHKNGENYQLLRLDVSVTKNYWTKRFPLESHQLRMYLESQYPIEEVVFVSDEKNSGLNENLSISGYDVKRHQTTTLPIRYESAHGDPAMEGQAALITSEHMTAIEINRSSWGLYLKCFVALIGTITWVLITMFINTYHHVDPLGMIPAALFGTVTNVMVGANLLPEALQLGLLEYVNFWGIMSILVGAISIIHVNRIRSKYEDREFAAYFGKVMFYTVLCFTVVGHILLPISAYMFY